jgi:putative peptidoglycan lipid II flippase
VNGADTIRVVKSILQSLLSQKRIAGGAAVLALTQLIASACGFLRDRAFSSVFPLESDPIGVASVYIAAFRPSDLLFQVFIVSCLGVVLVPFLASHLAHDRREEMNRIASSTLVVFGSLFGVIALLTAIIFPWIAPFMVKFTGPSLDLYISFGRIALLTNFLFVFGNTFGQYLITVQRYWNYGLTPILWCLSTIGGTYFLTPFFGPMGPIIGMLTGTILYVALRLVGAWKTGFRFTLGGGGLLHAELRDMGLLILPRMVAVGALQLQLLLLDRLASGLSTATVALNQFASNFESVIPGIVGISIGQSAFSILSQSVAKGDRALLRHHLLHGTLINLGLSIPGAIALALLAKVGGHLLNLQDAVLSTFTASLWIYCLAIPFESANHLILRSFYALKNTRWPALSSVISCTLAIAAGTILLPSLGVYALAVAYAVAQVSQAIFLGSSLAVLISRLR